MDMNANWLAEFAAALLSMMNPLGNAGMFATMTAQYSASDSKKTAWKCAMAVLAITLVSTWAGEWALRAAGINIAELRAGGGIIVLIIGLRMLFNDKSHAQTPTEANAALQRDSIAIVPLAIPIVAGPGTIALIVATASQHAPVVDRCWISSVCLVMSILIGFVFSAGNAISGFLGPSGMAVITRIMGMVLASIAMGMLATGIHGLFPELFQ